MSLPSTSQSENTQEQRDLYGIRNGTLFVVDTTQPMFKNGDDKPYFVQCIKHYVDILHEKLIWNTQDWMGLILFGTEKWNMDPETKNILTVHKLSPISITHIKDAIKISDEKWKYYKSISSSTSYPLHDVLWHAAQEFSAVKVTMPIRKVILFTCLDDPPLTDANEKHRIRVKMSSYNNIKLQLFVVGLGENWNHSHFYKDLEMLSRKIDSEDYNRTSLKDLLMQVKLPSRNMAKLKWRLGNNVALDVSLYNFSVKRKYLKRERISKETNEPLKTYTYYRKANDENEESENDDENEDKDIQSLVLSSEIRKTQKFGNRTIYFTLPEVKSLSNIREPGIDMICVKQCSYDPMYHFHSPYFVTCKTSLRKDNRLLFGALLHKCIEKNLMIVCGVTMRKHSQTNLYSMIPSTKYGGFYLYKIPFKQNVRTLDVLAKHVYDVNDNPADPEGIELVGKVIKKLKHRYDPDMFPNPKLQVQTHSVGILALDLEMGNPPADETLPLTDVIKEKVSDLIDQIRNLMSNELNEDYEPQRKRSKKSNVTSSSSSCDENYIQNCIKNRQLDTLTMPQLKEFLKKHHLKVSGTKKDLISRIYEMFT